jgi:hypothetical protein
MMAAHEQYMNSRALPFGAVAPVFQPPTQPSARHVSSASASAYDPSIVSQLVEQMGFNVNAATRAVIAGVFLLVLCRFIFFCCQFYFITSFVSLDTHLVRSFDPDLILAAAVDWLEQVSCKH